jgi:hypothetical protein
VVVTSQQQHQQQADSMGMFPQTQAAGQHSLTPTRTPSSSSSGSGQSRRCCSC